MSTSDFDNEPRLGRSGPYYVRAVGKALVILEALGDAPADMTLAEVCRRVGLNRATVYRLLATLSRHRLVQRTDTGRYRLGLGLLALGGTVQRQSVLAEHASPHLRRVARSLSMTSFLSVLDGDEGLCLQRIDAGPTLVVRYRLGERLPLHSGAGPLVLLAGLPDAEVERILAGDLLALTPRTVVDPAQVWERLVQVRRDGVAFSDQDVTIGVGAIGAPIRNPFGDTIAAVSVSAPVQVLFGEDRAEIVDAVRQTAAAISAEVAG